MLINVAMRNYLGEAAVSACRLVTDASNQRHLGVLSPSSLSLPDFISLASLQQWQKPAMPAPFNVCAGKMMIYYRGVRLKVIHDIYRSPPFNR